MFRAGLMSSDLSLWPAHQKENVIQMSYMFLNDETSSCPNNHTDDVAVLQRYCSIQTSIDSMVSTWAAEPVGNQRRAFANIHRLVLFRQGLWSQEPIVPGHTEQRVLLRWAMDICCPHLYNIITCREKMNLHRLSKSQQQIHIVYFQW